MERQARQRQRDEGVAEADFLELERRAQHARALLVKAGVPVHRKLELAPLVPRDGVLVVGKTGFGKSTFCKSLLEREMARGRRILWADYQDEYSELGEENEQRTLGPLLQRVGIDDLLAHPDVLEDPDLSMAVVMHRDPEWAALDFVALCELTENSGDLVFGGDEFGVFAEYCQKKLHYLATQHRHWGVSLVLASQRAVDIHPKARSQMSQLVTFNQSNPADISAIAELVRSETFADAVPSLDVGECLHWRDVHKRKNRKWARPSS